MRSHVCFANTRPTHVPPSHKYVALAIKQSPKIKIKQFNQKHERRFLQPSCAYLFSRSGKPYGGAHRPALKTKERRTTITLAVFQKSVIPENRMWVRENQVWVGEMIHRHDKNNTTSQTLSKNQF